MLKSYGVFSKEEVPSNIFDDPAKVKSLEKGVQNCGKDKGGKGEGWNLVLVGTEGRGAVAAKWIGSRITVTGGKRLHRKSESGVGETFIASKTQDGRANPSCKSEKKKGEQVS